MNSELAPVKMNTRINVPHLPLIEIRLLFRKYSCLLSPSQHLWEKTASYPLMLNVTMLPVFSKDMDRNDSVSVMSLSL